VLASPLIRIGKLDGMDEASAVLCDRRQLDDPLAEFVFREDQVGEHGLGSDLG
jgi:hypothetical protein